jgi:hypothetical protein
MAPSTAEDTTAWPGRLDACLVALLASLPFVPALWSDLVSDDLVFVAILKQVSTPFLPYVSAAVLRMQDVPTTFYRPLAFVSLLAEMRAWGDNPWLMHLTNLVLHALSALGVWWMVRQVVSETGVSATAERAAAIIAALQWAWFPRRVETVAWVSCRPDLLATTLGIWALAAWASGERRGSLWLRCVGVIAWFLAMASKESVVLLPLALIALVPAMVSRRETAAGSAPWLRAVRLWPFGLGLAAFLVLRRLALGAWVGGYGKDVLTPSLSTAFKHVTYPLLPPLEFLNRAMQHQWVSLVVAGIVVVGALALWGQVARTLTTRSTRLGVAWFVAAVLPVVTLQPSLTTTMNDRLLYLSGIGFAIMIGGWLARSGPRWRAAAAVIVCGLAVHTLSLANAWRVAGETTAVLVEQVGRVRRATPSGVRVFLVTAPDSYRGAYMLRNGIGHALQRLGVPDGIDVVTLSTYMLSDPGEMPVEVEVLPDGETVRLKGALGRPEVIVGASNQWVDVETSWANDRFGRHGEATLRMREPGVLLVVAPGGVRSPGMVQGTGSVTR